MQFQQIPIHSIPKRRSCITDRLRLKNLQFHRIMINQEYYIQRHRFIAVNRVSHSIIEHQYVIVNYKRQEYHYSEQLDPKLHVCRRSRISTAVIIILHSHLNSPVFGRTPNIQCILIHLNLIQASPSIEIQDISHIMRRSRY